MSSKTRKFIWSVPVVAAFAVIGALAVFGVLGLQNAQPVEAQAVVSAPGEPAALVVTAEHQGILVQWLAPTASAGTSPPTGYEIQYIVQDEGNDAPTATGFTPEAVKTVTVPGGTTTGWRISDLDNDGKEYFARIRATNSGGESGWSAIDPIGDNGANPAASAPEAPTGVSVAALEGSAEIEVTWDEANDGGDPITAYTVTYTVDVGAGVTVAPLDGDARKVTIVHGSALAAGAVVAASVTATNGEGEGSAGTGTLTVVATPVSLESSSSTGSAGIKLTLIVPLTENLTGSNWVEIYLEDDYQEPGSIPNAAIVFEARGDPTSGAANNAVDLNTTFAAAAVEVDDGGDLNGEDNAVVIFARIPDMKDGDATGYPLTGQTLIMVVSEAAGVKNPPEQGDHDNGYSIIGGTASRAGAAEAENIGDGKYANDKGELFTKAKISLNDEDAGRGAPITVTGTGFNNGTTATVKILAFKAAQDPAPSCAAVMDSDDSETLGTAVVGSDDKFTVTFTVHQDEFNPGAVNYICARDDEAPTNRLAVSAKVFDNEASVSVDPTSVNSGDEVTLKARDFGGALDRISLGGDENWYGVDDARNSFEMKEIDDNDYIFDMPGGLSGTVNVAAIRGSTTKRVDIVVTPSGLELSKSEVVANETVIISGRGFSERARIYVADITLDGDPVEVDDAGTSVDDRDTDSTADDVLYITTTSAGEFTATINIWAIGDGGSATDAGNYEIEAEDANGYSGSASITILEPAVSVTPAMASPRDYITISGTNWPADVNDLGSEVCIIISDGTVDVDYDSADVDTSGRFTLQYQLDGGIDIGTTHDVVVRFPDSGLCADDTIEVKSSFEVPESNVVLTPTAAAPGETISLEITGMPIYELVEAVRINGDDRLDIAVNTDSNGDASITAILVPFLTPGFYPVEVEVEDEIRVVQLEILAEATVAGTAQSVSDALSEISGSLVRVFHFNNTSKVWTFYDPRPEFEGLNTLSELANGQPYWILVSEGQENVVLNGQTRNLTCVGGDCWNQEVW